MRETAGLGPLQPDSLLDATARRHAEGLAARGAISHVGDGGSTVLDRWRAAGGTSLRIAEIIGAGEALPELESAWKDSPSHRKVVLDPAWTHVGWGSSHRGTAVVYVVLFSHLATRGLTFGWEGGQFMVRGCLSPRDADFPVLFSGLRRMEPVSWDTEKRAFVFRIRPEDFVPYLRLGYTSDSGILILTDAITPHEDGSRLPGP